MLSQKSLATTHFWFATNKLRTAAIFPLIISFIDVLKCAFVHELITFLTLNNGVEISLLCLSLMKEAVQSFDSRSGNANSDNCAIAGSIWCFDVS